jgi:vacuolar-type H+-ATPase subunit I/STV1
VARGINENKFDPIVDEKAQCQWCDYKQVCPAFSGKKSFSFQQPVLSDSISEVVDRYGKLTSKLNDLSQEKEKIEAQIRSYMKLQGQSILKGKYFLVEENISEPDTLSLINVRLLEPETSRENTN